jgi:hypothetical protein
LAAVTLPKPEPGLVIRYSYLWYAEYVGGHEEGAKDRPCALVMSAQSETGKTIVAVLPITHREPANAKLAMEIPQITKRRLGLDAARSWVLFSEANQFVWPGPDLRPLPGGDASTAVYGMLPPNFFQVLRDRYVAAFHARLSKNIPRTE